MFKRDEVTKAIINTDDAAYNALMMERTRSREMQILKDRIEKLEQRLMKLEENNK
jgi:polyhydroxyalkanoate synthesis regulator phasin